MDTPTLFTPSLLTGQELERLFVARQPTVDRVMGRVIDAAESTRRNHTLLIGPRGAGKTHLVSLVAYRTRQLIETGARLQLAWLPEDPWRVATYTHLLRAILAAGRQDAPREGIPAPGPPAAPEELERRVMAQARTGGPIVVIAENLDVVLAQIGDIGQQRLRQLLQADRSLLLVATTTALDASLTAQSAPFYGFFTTETLRPFTTDQARQMLRRLADAAEDRELVRYLDTPQATDRLQVIAHLAGGQPRIWALMATGLTVRGLNELVDTLLTRFDDLTPYYQERLARLSGQQRLIIAELADTDRLLYVGELAERLGADQRSVAKTVNDLVDRGWITETNSPVTQLLDRRRTYYELAEPLLRLAFQIKESRGKPVRLVVDFLRSWFDPPDLTGITGPAQAYARAALQSHADDPVGRVVLLLAGTRLPANRTDAVRFAGTVDDALARLNEGSSDDYLQLPSAIRAVLDRELDPGRLTTTVCQARLNIHAAVAAEFGSAPHPDTDAWVARAENLVVTSAPPLQQQAVTRLIDWYGRAWKLTEAAAAWEANRDDFDPLTAIVAANTLAEAYKAAGRFSDATALLKQTIAHAQHVLDSDDPDLIGTYHNLASAYLDAGDRDRAIELLGKVLADAERVFGVDDPRTITARNNLAEAHLEAGLLRDAIELLGKVLADAERVFGVDDPRTITSRNNLGLAYREAGQLDEATALLEATLASRARILGPGHPDTLAARNNLGLVYVSAGVLDRAIALFEQTLADSQRVLGPDHPDTLTARNNLTNARGLSG